MERPATLGNPDDPLAFNRPARAATCHLLASAIPARYRQRRELREDIANYLRDAAPMKARLATARILEALWRLTLAGRTRADGFPKR